MRDIADTGLNICLELINNISMQDPATANMFYQQYFLTLVADVLFVLADTDHKSGMISLYIRIIYYLISFIIVTIFFFY
jgi:exportin-1